MKRIICVHIIIMILINACVMPVFASGSSSESKNIEEANMLFHKNEIQNAKDMKEQCKDENTRIDNMPKNINDLEKEEDVWKTISEKKDNKTDVMDDDSEYSLYVPIINDLEKEYGNIRVVRSNYYEMAEEAWEVEGVCLLTLLDMDNTGTKELFAVCKEQGDDLYKGFVYTIKDGVAECVFKINETTLFTNGGFFNIAIIHTDGKDRIVSAPTKSNDSITKLYGFIDGQYRTYEYKCYLSYSSDTSKDAYYINDEKVDATTYSNSQQEQGLSDLYSSNNNTVLYVRAFSKDSLDDEKLNDITSKTKAIIFGESDAEESFNKDSNNGAWKSSYIEFIEADPDISTTSHLCTCGLIYVDNDDVPELIIEYGTWALGTKMVSYKDGELLSRSFAGEGGISYIERKGLVHNVAGHMGTMADEFASLDKDGFHDLGFGTRYRNEEDYTHYTDYQWNGDDVTKEEYDNYVESVFDESQAKRWNAYDDESSDNVYTVESLLNYLR